MKRFSSSLLFPCAIIWRHVFSKAGEVGVHQDDNDVENSIR